MASRYSVSTKLRARRNIVYLVIVFSMVGLFFLIPYLNPKIIMPLLILTWVFTLCGGFVALSVIRCPYCQAAVNGFVTRSGQRWYSPAIMDECPNCKRDLTLPYDPSGKLQYEKILSEAEGMLARGASVEDILVHLRRSGLSKVPSIRMLVDLKVAASDKAKFIVHESAAWADVREGDEEFHRTLYRAIDDL